MDLTVVEWDASDMHYEIEAPKDVHDKSAIMVCEVKSDVKTLPVYIPLNVKV